MENHLQNDTQTSSQDLVISNNIELHIAICREPFRLWNNLTAVKINTDTNYSAVFKQFLKQPGDK